MQADAACRYINELMPRPGYSHRARVIDTTHVSVRIICNDAPESSPDRPGYRQFNGMPLPRWYEVDTSGCLTRADVARELVACYLTFDSHELREYLRDSTGQAPLHPHTPRGKAAWNDQGMPGEVTQRDPSDRELVDLYEEAAA